MTDTVEDILARLDALARGVDEARAAAQIMRDGDPTAAAELGEVVDAMAGELAALKTATSNTRLG